MIILTKYWLHLLHSLLLLVNRWMSVKWLIFELFHVFNCSHSYVFCKKEHKMTQMSPHNRFIISVMNLILFLTEYLFRLCIQDNHDEWYYPIGYINIPTFFSSSSGDSIEMTGLDNSNSLRQTIPNLALRLIKISWFLCFWGRINNKTNINYYVIFRIEIAAATKVSNFSINRGRKLIERSVDYATLYQFTALVSTSLVILKQSLFTL